MNNENINGENCKIVHSFMKKKDESKHRKNNTDIYLIYSKRHFPCCSALGKQLDAHDTSKCYRTTKLLINYEQNYKYFNTHSVITRRYILNIIYATYCKIQYK